MKIFEIEFKVHQKFCKIVFMAENCPEKDRFINDEEKKEMEKAPRDFPEKVLANIKVSKVSDDKSCIDFNRIAGSVRLFYEASYFISKELGYLEEEK